MGQYESDRAAIARVMYDEARRLRDLQDDRIRDVQQRSITVLALVSAAVTVVAGVASSGNISSNSLKVAAVAVVGMVLSGVVVHMPKGGYREGPNVRQINDEQYQAADPGYRAVRDVALYHYSHWTDNNRAVLKWINRGFAAELVFASLAVVSIVMGAAL